MSLLTRLARAPVFAIAGAQFGLLLSLASRYGYHRDELYFIEAGEHLAWGYVDQPPFTPFVARLSSSVFGESVTAIRVLPAAAAALTVVITSLLVRELGGGRRAQVLAAAAVAGSGFALGTGHLLATATFDLLAWMALIWLTARLLRTGDARWWLPFGAVAGLALLNKHLVVLLAVAVVAGAAVERRWDVLRVPWLLSGGVLAALIALPNLLWQADNSWPQVEMAVAISNRLAGENRTLLLPGQLVLLGPLLAPLLFVGIRWLVRPGAGRPFRPLLWAWVVAVVLTFASAGRPYYPIPLAIAALAAGTIAWESRWVIAVIVVSAITVAPIALPLLPADQLSEVPLDDANEPLRETVGWPELADQVAAIVDRLPADERERVVIMTATYGEAGALDRFGPARHLPEPYSPHNNYWHWRRPTDDGAPVIVVRYPAQFLAPYFETCREVDRVDNSHNVDNEVQGTPIVLCRGPVGGWSEVWPALRHYT